MPKILFISYYFPPFAGVGAKRVAYWAEEISKMGIEAHVITATEQESGKKSTIHYVKNSFSKRLLSTFIKDEGYSWEKDLLKFFSRHKVDNYDYVLISGGPFMHMSITKQLKTLAPNTKVVLDFRDPFSQNPRFNEGWIRRSIKTYFEKRFCKYADAVITVNKYCADLIASPKTVEIIENGFDERTIKIPEKKSSSPKFSIAHAGSLYEDRNPSNFLAVVRDLFVDQIVFEQYGQPSEFLTNHRDQPYCKYKGLFNYSELCKELYNASACVLFTGGKAFESTTKIFDYIALGKAVLIVTEGDVETGNLQEITRTYPNVVWSINEASAIEKAIHGILQLEAKPFDSSIFSRKESLKRLVQLLKQL